MAVLNEAACEIQRMVRGWLARVKMERFKQQVALYYLNQQIRFDL